MSLSIGWCGYGNMGRPMCLNLARRGFAVSALDIDPDRIALMGEDGIRPCASLAELVGNDVVVTMLWDDATFRAVTLGQGGLVAALPASAILVDMSTLSPKASGEVAEMLAGRGIAYLRAPVSGAEALAATADLTVYASGPRDAFERCLPMLEAVSRVQRYVGTAEESRYLKLIINMMVSASNAVLGEALSFAERAGVDAGLALDAINDSIVGSRHFRSRSESIRTADMRPSGRWFGMKDMNLAMAAAAEVGAAMPLMGLVQQELQLVVNRWPGANTAVAMAHLMRRINPSPTTEDRGDSATGSATS